MTTIASKYGTASQKGTALGIFRSLGALARAVGPVVASIGKLNKFCREKKLRNYEKFSNFGG